MSFFGGSSSPAPAPLPPAAPPPPPKDVDLREQRPGALFLAGGVTDLENEVESLGAPSGGAKRRAASKTLLG